MTIQTETWVTTQGNNLLLSSVSVLHSHCQTHSISIITTGSSALQDSITILYCLSLLSYYIFILKGLKTRTLTSYSLFLRETSVNLTQVICWACSHLKLICYPVFLINILLKVTFKRNFESSHYCGTREFLWI